MASTIAAVTTGAGGVITTADSSGNLSLLSGATTVVAVTAAGATVTGTLAATGATNLGALTTTGNTILGDASTDTLNVGNGGLVKDASGNVGIGTASPTTGVRADIVSDNTAQQFVNVLKVSTTNTGDYHPAILFENNRSSVLNSMKLCLDTGATAGTSDFKVQTKDSGGTFNTRFTVTNAGLLQFNSGYGSAATAYGCRAWVNFNGGHALTTQAFREET